MWGVELFIEVWVGFSRKNAIHSAIYPIFALPPASEAYFLLAFVPHMKPSMWGVGNYLFIDVWVGYLRKNAIPIAIYPFSRFRQLPPASVAYFLVGFASA